MALGAMTIYAPVERRLAGPRQSREGAHMSAIEGPAIDFFTDLSLITDPYPYYEEVRAHGPVWQEPVHGAFVVTGYDEISAVYRDSTAFSSLNSFSGPLMRLP